MLSPFSLHRRALPALAIAAVLTVGCASSRPEVKVLGVSQARRATDSSTLVVFVEVVNPSSTALQLSRLEYQLEASSWFRTRGKVALGRSVGAGSSAVVEIPVEASSDVPSGAAYALSGKLFARENRVERSWKVRVKGALSETTASRPLRLQLADRSGR